MFINGSSVSNFTSILELVLLLLEFHKFEFEYCLYIYICSVLFFFFLIFTYCILFKKYLGDWMIEGETDKQYDMALEMFENQIIFPCTTEVIDFLFTLRRSGLDIY